jgi:hypothetical protein
LFGKVALSIIDRIPLVIRVQQPRVELDIQILEVDTSTLVTRARLTNLGDTLTDLTLDIVQDTTGIPANMIIQPDIQHTYLQAGQSLEVTFIPLDVQSAEAAPANVSTPLFDPLTGASLNSQPSLMALAGPYRVTAHARNTTLPNVTLRDGTLTNTCGADGSDRTIAAECTTPAGTETVIANSWYCTNRPNVDVGITLALPDGGLGVPITDVSVGANFTPGGYGAVYTHSTTLALNGSLVGSAIVPSQPRIEGSVAPETLVLGGSSPAQILNLRSTHTNDGHYTIASGFTVTVDYDAHTRTGCFSQAEIDAANGALMCAVDPSLVIPDQSLDMSLMVDPAAQAPQTEDGAFVFTVGEQIPLIAQVSAAGTENIGDTVRVELTVPRGLVPQGMTIAGEDQSLLDQIFSDLTEFLATLGLPFSEDYENGLGVAGDDDQVTFVYDYDRDLVIGQPLPITLDIVGEVPDDYTILGNATTLAFASPLTSTPQLQSASNTLPNSFEQRVALAVQVNSGGCEVDITSSRQVFAYTTPFDALRGEPTEQERNITGMQDIPVFNRSEIDPNIVFGAFVDSNELMLLWFYSGDGNASLSAGDCSTLRTTSSDNDNDPAIQVLNQTPADGAGTSEWGSWSEYERREIAHAIEEIDRAFMTVSSNPPATPMTVFNRVFMTVPTSYPQFTLLVRADTSDNSLWRPPGQTTEANDLDIPDVTVTFSYQGENVTGYYADINNGNCKAFEARQTIVSDPNITPRTTTTVFMPSAIICNGQLDNQTSNTSQPPSDVFGEASQYTIVHEFGHIFDYLVQSELTTRRPKGSEWVRKGIYCLSGKGAGRWRRNIMCG